MPNPDARVKNNFIFKNNCGTENDIVRCLRQCNRIREDAARVMKAIIALRGMIQRAAHEYLGNQSINLLAEAQSKQEKRYLW